MTDLESSQAPPRMNPPVRRRGDGPRRGGPLGFAQDQARVWWRWLTRMKTALILLGFLGLETFLATWVPQEPNVPTTVAEWRAGIGGPGEVLAGVFDLFGLFDVYGSPLFLAVLLLLFLSLTACLVPRIRAFVRLARRGQPPLTRHLGDQPHVDTVVTTADTDTALEVVRSSLSRWRIRPVDTDRPEQVAAEAGILSREGGSLVFHLSFYVLLVGIILNQLLSFEGQVAVVEATSITDSPAIYAGPEPGRWWNDTDHPGFNLALDEFRIDWIRSLEFQGQPSLFESLVTITEQDGTAYTDTIGGNDPLIVDGMKIHQLAWGYAPEVLVLDADGEQVAGGPLVATETNQGFFRSAVKAPSADPDIGVEVQFWPWAPSDEDGRVSFTGAPWADDPILRFEEFRGDLNLLRPQNVSQLDTRLMTSESEGFLRPGQVAELSDGAQLVFLGWRRWVGFQMSYRPMVPVLLLGSFLLLVGLVPALYAYRRRLWVQVEPIPDGGTIVTVAGRAFQREERFADEFADLVTTLERTLP